ncbi:uncharacterized protein [Epargyreus clarus]|uniref:uncharacterized protein n=1 Tax=Epargyreus clarus TaxID=520877 RepID=UPI003C2D2E45
MDATLACGDNNNAEVDNNKPLDQTINVVEEASKSREEEKVTDGKMSLETVCEKELKLKERIANCRRTIESLKLELTEEKAKLQEESKSPEIRTSDASPITKSRFYADNMASSNLYTRDTLIHSDTAYMCSASVDNKLRCDESLMEYEKQLQRYQNTLSMAQAEKKNAIRKQMLAKAYKLKLLEVENQCNIELLRVKQSLQCLEPLQMIVNKWKTSDNKSSYNLNSYELIPRYSELNPISTNDVNIFTDDEKCEFVAADDDVKI